MEQLLPTAGSLDPQARAELLWMAAATANEAGDGAAALAASQRLAPLLAEIDDPFLHAVSQLVIAWTWPITGDFDGTIRAASASLEQLRGQDEPYWTAAALVSLGYMEKAAGRDDDALRHLREARDLAKRFGYAWLATWSQVQLGTLAVGQGQLGEARALLNDGLALSLEAHSTQNVSLCLAAYARLAFADGDPARAALLAGAAEGLRPAGWPGGVAGAPAGGGRAGGSAPPGTRRGPVRGDVQRRHQAQPAGGGGRRFAPVHRHPGVQLIQAGDCFCHSGVVICRSASRSAS